MSVTVIYSKPGLTVTDYPAEIKTGRDLADACVHIACCYKTLYVMGCFGAPLSATNKQRYIQHHPYNTKPERADMIRAATVDTFGFDCVNLIKGILWGWDGNRNAIYGGAKYLTNNVPDVSADGMMALLRESSSDFGKIEVGEAVWCKGHIGVYIGNGLSVECTPSWENKVQVTACNCSKAGYNRRNWAKHGKLPFISYGEEVNAGEWVPRVGEYVRFTGDKHYVSANSSEISGRACKPGKAKVFRIFKNAKHPYSLVYAAGGSSTVYGWVDSDCVEKWEG